MTTSQVVLRLLDQCDIYFEESIISKETIIRSYAGFLAEALDGPAHSVSVAQHTGFVCFDAVSFLIAALGCFTLNDTAHDDVIRSFENGQMVLYNNERYLWSGFAKKQIDELKWVPTNYVPSGFENAEFILLEQPSNSSEKNYVPRHRWNRVMPYKGTSTRTDGRGIRRAPGNRNDFISYLFGVPVESIPSVLGVSTVIVTDSEAFRRTVKELRVEYGEGKSVGLLDLVTASYFTYNLEEHQVGENPGKTQPNLKVTSRISAARDLVLDKSGNRTVGFMVVGEENVASWDSELLELLSRKALTFSMFTASVDSTIAPEIIKANPDASIFFCTKEFLLLHSEPPKVHNPLTAELDNQIESILNNEILPITVDGVCTWQELRIMENSLSAIRRSDLRKEEKDDFIITAYTLKNLALTAVFPLSSLNQALEQGALSSRIIPPSMRLHSLWESARSATELPDQFRVVAETVERLYHAVLSTSPKYDALINLLGQYAGQKIALVVPKAYYVDLLKMDDAIRVQCATIVSANQFNHFEHYDLIVVTGDFAGTKFNPLNCRSAPDIVVLLYDGEARSFGYKMRQADAYEKTINVRLGIEKPNPANGDGSIETEALDDVRALVVAESDLERYIERIALFDVFAKKMSGYSSDAHFADVYAVGRFRNGQQVMFTRYYRAVVFDEVRGTVIEKDVDSLRPGDIIVFANRDDHTKNMVDVIYGQLQQAGRFSQSVKDATEKAQYWKRALSEYKDTHGLSYRDVAKELRATGEVSVRQWLVPDSHIIGPRDKSTLTQIAHLTQDTLLLENPQAYFEACEIVRQQRKNILKLIGKAIVDKLSGLAPTSDELLEFIFRNVDDLSATLKLDDISVLDQLASVPATYTNRPIKDMETTL